MSSEEGKFSYRPNKITSQFKRPLPPKSPTRDTVTSWTKEESHCYETNHVRRRVNHLKCRPAVSL